jgi:hypothetical protein
MPGGSVYKDHICIARNFTVQYKYMNIIKHNKQKIHKYMKKHTRTLENTKKHGKY